MTKPTHFSDEPSLFGAFLCNFARKLNSGSMQRKIYDELLKWKHEEQGVVALLIEGARRVGKSYIVEEFAKKEYKSYILVDFAHIGKSMKAVFDEYLSETDTFLMYQFRMPLMRNSSKAKNYTRNLCSTNLR